jgi:hypothetical protein
MSASPSLDVIKAIYRQAVDATVSDSESPMWWNDVAIEMREVVSAPTAREAARVIAWCHHDWTCVSDTPLAAARRIRQTARSLI